VAHAGIEALLSAKIGAKVDHSFLDEALQALRKEVASLPGVQCGSSGVLGLSAEDIAGIDEVRFVEDLDDFSPRGRASFFTAFLVAS